MTSRTGPGGGPLGFRHKRVQRLRRLVSNRSYRQSERAFVVEGPKLVDEALRAGAPVEGLYAAPEGITDPVVEQARQAGVRVFPLAAGVLERATDTVTPQPVLAIAGQTDVALDDLRGREPLVVCVDVRDPGNLGTVLRTAEASGAGGVICCDGTVDVYNPKCVRASAGSVFHVRLVAGGDPVEVLERVGAWGLRRLGTAVRTGTPYHRVDLTQQTALVLGNEASGVPSSVVSCIDDWITIPMTGRAESLNVGMAAAVLCFEAARQRGQ
ncbi:MAG: RNA methyltransferase [Actinomycetota bacterium]|nr:RNA methyltransferase [Actinomycetota bacterium]